MKRILFGFLALFFPWVIFLLEEKVGLAFLAMALQVTIIGWLPMTVLAFNHRDNLSYFQRAPKKAKKAKSDEEVE
ncbi:MAG: hypothetical protein K0U37_03250 [Gammaproteobacteria bacterium]|nr:hypothetical protein [Gammaproteobacteria bacterium]